MRRILAAAMLLAVCSQAGLRAGEMHSVDLSKQSNQKLDDGFGRMGPGNHLSRLPKGTQTFNDVVFEVGEGVLQLGGKILEKFPDRIDGIPVNRTCGRIHLLHSTCYGGHGKTDVPPEVVVKDETQIGEYIVHYEDGATSSIPLIYGRDVRDWWYVEGDSEPPSLGQVAWAGENDYSDQTVAGVRVYSSVWDNPYPEKTIKTIDFVGRKSASVAAPFCIAITLEDHDKAKGAPGEKAGKPVSDATPGSR
ncbi:hypothetical protein Pan44_21090 [Caulifigura coniformis]|uniref:Uncharacterized protein n=1 Tax=Caulifigura coniformis TaxID=2527983 RepID=A0A517SD72_9PLAN|nr:hypothetical protein [Caulifigura coniformis]QDT54082.1 hypothetical protein Pan44_21090 [Caulifigura coniformis]